MRISEARQILAEYQALLDLKEWDIRLRWAKAGELPDDFGQCRWQPEYKVADVLLLRSQPEREIPHSIIHELLELRLKGHTLNETPYDPQYEHGLNRIAAAILSR